MHQFTRMALLAGFVGFGGSACGDDGDDNEGASQGDGRVPDSTKFSDVTAAQSQSLCEEFQAAGAKVDAQKSGICALSALSLESDGYGTCEETYAGCLEDDEIDSGVTCGPESRGQTFDCPQATVGDFRGCFLAATENAAEFYGSGITCDDDFEELEFPERPAACDVLFDKCPELAVMVMGEPIAGD